MALPSGDVFFLDNFAVRQWDDPFYAGTRLTIDKEEFVKKIHEYHQDGACLVDGYAPFCKCASASQRPQATLPGRLPCQSLRYPKRASRDAAGPACFLPTFILPAPCTNLSR